MALVTNMCAYEELVKQKLPKMVYDFFAFGTEDQWTLRKNREAFSRIFWSYFQTLSSWSSCRIEEVNSTGPGIRFFQLLIYKDKNLVQQLIQRAEKAVYKVIVDAPWLGRREADVKNSSSCCNRESRQHNQLFNDIKEEFLERKTAGIIETSI